MPLTGRGKVVPLPYLLWDKTPFFLMQEVVWNYGAGVACRNSFSPRNEFVVRQDGKQLHIQPRRRATRT